MKRLIFLKVEDPNPDDKKIKKSVLEALEKEKQQEAVEKFKADLKQVTFAVKVISELPEAQVIIEFDDNDRDVAYEFLRKLDVVSLIDSIMPVGY